MSERIAWEVTGEYVSAFLGGMVASEGIRVLYRFPNDHILMRLLVVALLAISTIHTCWFEWIVHHYVIGGFDDYRKLNDITPQFGGHVLLSRTIVLISQLYFCHRLWIFSNKNWLCTSLSLFLALFHLGAAIATSIRFIQGRHYTELKLLLILNFVYSSTIAGDVVITGYLIYYLSKHKSHFMKTQSIIKRIMLLSFETSFLTTALAIVSIILLGRVGLGILYSLTLPSSQLYILSILVTMNSRFSFAKALAKEENKSIIKAFPMKVTKQKTSNHRHCEGVGVEVDQVIYTDCDADVALSIPRFAKVRSALAVEQNTRPLAVPVRKDSREPLVIHPGRGPNGQASEKVDIISVL